MATNLPREPAQLLKDAEVRNQALATALRAAATEGNAHHVRRLLTELLRGESAPTDENIQIQLQTLEDLFHTLRRLAMTDELTRLNNRRGFLRVCGQLLRAVDRERYTVRLVHVDVDNLKHVNDTVGHKTGDRLLQRTADVLRALFPHHDVYDVIGRLGGDEFAVLTLVRDGGGRGTLAMRIQNAVDELNARQVRPALSLSVGVSELLPHESPSIDHLLVRAERAMYEHKISKWSRIALDTRNIGALAAAS